MHRGLEKRLLEFIEQEKLASVDPVLLEQLWAYTAMETMYWRLPAVERNTLNAFYRGMVDDIVANMVSGPYGAQVVLESAIVSAFEAGVRYGVEDTASEISKEESKGAGDDKGVISDRQL